ncbi:MAG: hypothetical protein GX638_08005, partial [Crenarchaeota archaeon]|nr:hypothetical protein [Thermoproteota archaeon]
MRQISDVRSVCVRQVFSLSIRGVKELFAGFSFGDFAVVYGSSSVGYLISLLCVRAQLPVQLGGLASSVVFVDGGNSFRLYQTAKLARIHQIDPRRVLDHIYISRAFTAYQIVSLITQQLRNAVEMFNAKFVVISDIARMFLDKDIPEEEAKIIYRQVMEYLAGFVKENQVVLVVTCPPRLDLPRYESLKSATCESANVVLALKQSKYRREFVLEKHNCFALGKVELPFEH